MNRNLLIHIYTHLSQIWIYNWSLRFRAPASAFWWCTWNKYGRGTRGLGGDLSENGTMLGFFFTKGRCSVPWCSIHEKNADFGVFKMVEMMMSPYFSIGQLGLRPVLADFFGEFPGSTAEHRWSMYSSLWASLHIINHYILSYIHSHGKRTHSNL